VSKSITGYTNNKETMQTIKSNEYRPIPWSSIVLAELPSILFILQLSTNAANQAWIILLLILISGGYLILHSYKKHVFTVSLFLPFIGVLVMETWIFLDWLTNPHSSLLLTRVLLLFLCIPSLVLLYTKRSNLKKAVWLILVAFVIMAKTIARISY